MFLFNLCLIGILVCVVVAVVLRLLRREPVGLMIMLTIAWAVVISFICVLGIFRSGTTPSARVVTHAHALCVLFVPGIALGTGFCVGDVLSEYRPGVMNRYANRSSIITALTLFCVGVVGAAVAIWLCWACLAPVDGLSHPIIQQFGLSHSVRLDQTGWYAFLHATRRAFLHTVAGTVAMTMALFAFIIGGILGLLIGLFVRRA